MITPLHRSAPGPHGFTYELVAENGAEEWTIREHRPNGVKMFFISEATARDLLALSEREIGAALWRAYHVRRLAEKVNFAPFKPGEGRRVQS